MKINFHDSNGIKCAIRDDILEFVQRRAYGKQVMSNDKLSNYPSEIGNCRRKIYYEWTGAKHDGDVDYPGQRTFAVGNLMHEYFGQMWSRAGFFLNEEAHGSNREINASFRPDFVGIIRNKQCAKLFGMKIGEVFLIDFKTSSNRAYEYKDKGTATPGIPKEEHELQLQFYLGEMRRYLGDDALCRFGFLMYFSKDWSPLFWNGRWKQKSQFKWDVALLQIPADDKKYKKGLAYFKEIEVAVNKKKVPAKEGSSKNGYPCSYCDYTGLCWK